LVDRIGGRYDDLLPPLLVRQFRRAAFPSRKPATLRAESAPGAEAFNVAPLIVVLVLDKAAIAESFRLAADLRQAGFPRRSYVGESG